MELLALGVPDWKIESGLDGIAEPGPTELAIKMTEDGQEALGVVLAAGSKVGAMGPGDRVIACAPCARSERRPGEIFIDEAKNWAALPRELTEFAALVEPLAVAEKALSEISPMQERFPRGWRGERSEGTGRHRALVMGDGPAALLAAMALIEGGFETRLYSEGSETGSRACIAEGLGARLVSQEELRTHHLAGGLGEFDLIYHAGGDAAATLAFAGALASEGILIFAEGETWRGWPEAVMGRLMRDFLRKGQVFFGSVRPTSNSYEDAIRDLGEFARRWPEALRALAAQGAKSEAAVEFVELNAG